MTAATLQSQQALAGPGGLAEIKSRILARQQEGRTAIMGLLANMRRAISEDEELSDWAFRNRKPSSGRESQAGRSEESFVQHSQRSFRLVQNETRGKDPLSVCVIGDKDSFLVALTVPERMNHRSCTGMVWTRVLIGTDAESADTTTWSVDSAWAEHLAASLPNFDLAHAFLRDLMREDEESKA